MIRNLPFIVESSIHDFEYYSVFYGESFLFESYIYYFDTHDLRINGYSSNGQPIEKNILEALLSQTITLLKPRKIILETPKQIRSVSFNAKYKRSTILRPMAIYDFEIFAPTTHQEIDVLKKKNIRFSENKFEIIISEIELTYSHLGLISEFIKLWKDAPFYKSEYISSFYFLKSRSTSKLVSCYFKGELVGFSIISLIDKLGILHKHITLNKINGISDVLYFNSIKYLISLECERISLGFTLNKSLYNFKNKWGVQNNFSGCYEVIWHKDSIINTDMWATRSILNT